MTPREVEEYSALRATIRERGTARVWTFVVGLVAWSGLVAATMAFASVPIATLLPLLVLAGVFEAVFALHVGVERVGRYLQVFYETPDERGWEHTAMDFGTRFAGLKIDPLFCVYFWLGAVLNFIPAMLAGAVPIEWSLVGAAHVIFVGRVGVARRQASRQRSIDLARFEELKSQNREPRA
jgi:hypothetical protein